ncbi:MAG: glycosyltransferase WbsX family protein [Planctomycetota bacterium]|jgi:hypothetical protein
MQEPTRRQILKQSGAALGSAFLSAGLGPAVSRRALAGERGKPYQVGAYYFPNYHVDPRNEARYGRGWTEWELVKAARPRFPGHRQPRVPAWGYENEADPKVMEKKIDAAADHGVDYWIFDWYWYDDGPFLDRCLEEGYFGAKNNARVKFCCMWANHDWIDLFPYRRGAPRTVLYPGTVARKTFDSIVDHVISRYFQHPAHWKIDGRPYFSIYHLNKLLESFGGLSETRKALDDFRARTQSAGFSGLHLNAVVWGRPVLPGEGKPINAGELVARLGFDSVTSYVWIHHVRLPEFKTDYRVVQQGYFRYWEQAEKIFPVPYYPNVSVGWDSSPRTDQSDEYGNFGYPFTNTIVGNTPERFRDVLLATKTRLEQSAEAPRILNINSWNEWTEGSYLEPDTEYGFGYLEAIRAVFGGIS